MSVKEKMFKLILDYYGPATMDSLLATVCEDSLDYVELIMDVEDVFLIEIDDEDAEKMVTVRHLITYVENRCDAATRQGALF